MPRPSDFRILAIFAALAPLAACTVPGGLPFDEQERVVYPTEADEGRDQRVLVEGPRITAESRAALDVELPAGSVTIIRDRALHEPVVEVRRFSPNPERAGVGRGEELVRAGTVVEEGRMLMRVRPQIGALREGERYALTIRTPNCQQVMVRNGGGDVEIIGCGGEIAVSSGDIGASGGSIRVRTEEPITGPVLLTTTSGDVQLFGPSTGSAGRLELMTDSGDVTVSARQGELLGHHVPQRFTGVLNDGRNDIILRTGNGDINVRFADYGWERRGVSWRGRAGTR